MRDRLTQAAITSAALSPTRAVDLVRAVFDAVAVLLRSPSAADDADADDRLTRLWEEHRLAPFPASFRGVDIEGVELILLDADVAGLVQRELKAGLDDSGIAILWACVDDLDKIVPLINEQYCVSYFMRLRTAAKLVAARHVPPAS